MKLSIIRLITISAAIYLLLSSIPFYFAYKDLLEEIQLQTQKDYQSHLNTVASWIGSYVDFLQRHTNELASNKEIQDIAAFWEEDEIQAWTIKTRSLLPDTIGLAIFGAEGEILGEPKAQQVGRECLQEIKKHFNNTYTSRPPVHRSKNELSHFDLYGEITTSGGDKYVLLHSFKLNLIRKIIAESLNNESHYIIRDNTGSIIIESGDLTHGVMFKVPIPGTTWNLSTAAVFEQELSIVQFAKQFIWEVSIVLIVLLTLAAGFTFLLLQHDSKALQQLLLKVGQKQDNKMAAKRLFLQDFNIIQDGIISQNNHLIKANSKIKKMALEDSLTGLGNRHLFEIEQSGHLNRAKRGNPISVLALDLDDFKPVNDNYGHAVGDHVLIAFANALKGRVRESDSVYRFGGDEFIVILYATEIRNIAAWYQELLQKFIHNCHENQEIPEIEVHISGGASMIHGEDSSLSQVIQRADQALYQSKERGRGLLSISSYDSV